MSLTLDQCARHLARLRPAYPKGTQHHISNLIQQLKNYPLNRDALRPAAQISRERNTPMAPITLDYASLEPSRWSTVVCGGEVRWCDGKLQQRFVVTDYVGSTPSGSKQEWRDVPTVTNGEGK